MQCEFEEDGKSKSCIGPDNDYIFTSVREDLCEQKKIRPVITYTMCNENGANSQKIVSPKNSGAETYFRFKNQDLPVPNVLGDLPPNGQNCRTYVHRPVIDTCVKNYPLSIKLEGNMRKSPNSVVPTGTNSFCYCYLYKRGRIHKYPAPPPGPTPTTPPPAPVPTPPVCNFSDVIITEVGSPSTAARYIEVFFRDCVTKATIVEDDIKVNRNGVQFSLQGLPLPSDGIIVICVNKIGHGIFFNYNNCDHESPVADNPGTQPVTVSKGAFPILDVFNPFPFIPFTTGKAMRIKPIASPGPNHSPNQWIILPGNPNSVGGGQVDNPRGMDPGVWYTPLLISRIDDPADNEPFRYITIDQPFTDATVLDNLQLVIFDDDTGEPDFGSAIPLSNSSPTLKSDGLKNIRVCNAVGPNCDIISSNSSLPGTAGCYTVGIILVPPGTANDNYVIVDLYGVRGQSCAGTPFDFEGGTAVRKIPGSVPVSIWNPIQWDITIPIKLIITEITDPLENEKKYRFVELYSPNKKNYVIQTSDNLLLKTTIPSSGDSIISLTGLQTDQNGLLVLCTSNDYYQQRCNYVLGEDTAADTPGTAVVEILKGQTIVDVYGLDGTGQYKSFVGGRVNRLTDTINPTFDSTNWYISPGSGNSQTSAQFTDPGCWNGIGNCNIGLPPITSGNELILFITEVSDLPNRRFIELFSPNKKNYVITETLYLKLMTPLSNGGSFILLQGMETNADGFIVICSSYDAQFDRCDDQNSFINNHGTQMIALVDGANSNLKIDSYGRENIDNTFEWYFTNGRANRRTSAPGPYTVDNWTLYSNGNTPADPGCWNGIGDCSFTITNPPVTSPPPPNSPSKGGKGGKGKSNKRRRTLRRRV